MRLFTLLILFLVSLSAFGAGDDRNGADFALLVDLLDTPIMDTSSVNIPANSTTAVTVVSSLASNVAFCHVANNTSGYFGIYESSTLKAISHPNESAVVRCPMASGSAVKLRSMEASAISSGKVAIEFYQ